MGKKRIEDAIKYVNEEQPRASLSTGPAPYFQLVVTHHAIYEDKVKQKERAEGGKTPVLGGMTPKAFARTPSATSLSSGAGLSSPSTPKANDGKPEKRRKKKKSSSLLQEG